MFSNLRGCDGQRVYFNGCSCIALNGQMVARYKDYKVKDVWCIKIQKNIYIDIF